MANGDGSHLLMHKNFYDSNDVVHIAKQLLGKHLITVIEGKLTSGIIVETEAYRGPDDRGCHAYNGRKTERTSTMYLQGGVAYVYICYGMHPMFNVVSGGEGNAHAVLIRAIEPLQGLNIMQERRNQPEIRYNLTNGPAKLAVALGITKEMDGSALTSKDNPIYIEDHGQIIAEKDIFSGPRVGMTIHVGSCAHRPWRFYIRDNKWVSKPLKVDYSGKW